MALVDADYKFIWADIGGMGSASDAQIYNASELKECVEDGSICFPDPDPLPNDNQDVPYWAALCLGLHDLWLHDRCQQQEQEEVYSCVLGTWGFFSWVAS